MWDLVQIIIDQIYIFLWAIIMIRYLDIFLERREWKSKLYFFTVIIVICIIDSYILQPIIPVGIPKIIYSVFGNSIFAFALYKNKFKTVMLVTLLYDVICFLLDGLIWVFVVFGNIDTAGVNLLIIRVIISILQLMIIQIIKAKYHGNIDGEVTFIYWGMSLLAPMCSIFIIYIIIDMNIMFQNIRHFALSAIASTLIILLNLFIFSTYDRLMSLIKQNTLILEQQAKMYKQQSKEREAIWLESKRLNHDLKNKFTGLIQYAQENEYSKISEFINQVIGDYSFDHFRHQSGNMLIDSLLSFKMQKAEESKIAWHTEFEVTSQLPFADMDLCVIIGNALDNSIEAVEKIDLKKRQIHLKINFAKNILKISIINPYPSEIKKDYRGNILTVKADKANHGIGLDSMKKTIDKYDGEMLIETKGNQFELSIIMYGKKGLISNAAMRKIYKKD